MEKVVRFFDETQCVTATSGATDSFAAEAAKPCLLPLIGQSHRFSSLNLRLLLYPLRKF